MLVTGVLVRCMEKEGIALCRETSAGQILENLSKHYLPHKDKGNFNTRIRQMQAAFEETLEANPLQTLLKKDGNVNQSISFFNLLFAFLQSLLP